MCLPQCTPQAGTPPGADTCPGVVCSHGGTCPGGCLLPGCVSAPGGVPAWGGVCSGGVCSQGGCVPAMDRYTPQEQTPPGQVPPRADNPPLPGSRLWHTVNEQPVRILLECILVFLDSLLLAATKLGQGNVFTGVCDSVHRGGCVCLSAPPRQVPPQEQTPAQEWSAPRGVPAPGGVCSRGVCLLPGVYLPGGVSVLGVSAPRGDVYLPWTGTPPRSRPPLVRYPPEQTIPPCQEADSGIQSMSSRYASYWNAFLYFLILYYWPQRSWAKVMFLQVCVILFTGGWGKLCLSACWDTTHLPPPGADTSPRSRHPPGADPPNPPWEQTSPQEQTPPRADAPPSSRPPPP